MKINILTLFPEMFDALNQSIIGRACEKQIIDNLVYKIYVSDDNTTVYLNIKGSQNIESIDYSEHSDKLDSLQNKLKGVRTQLPASRQLKPKSNLI